ncbi:MAG TPA: adenylosuccinate synthase [Chloroflexi bacterium]|jgi:adenylosuccinate synthase|nr:adenylosuccinate synthase [Chloroflexota bacterium]
MPAIVVIGAQWGDEGKGKIVDHLAERAALVVRFQGGNNAGHTVMIGDTVLKLHQVPSGITRPNVAAVMGHGMVINPPALVEELEMLESHGVVTDNLHISANAHVVMPYHLALDALEEQRRGPLALGTTKRGIGPAYTDKVARRGLRMQDLVEVDRFRRRTAEALERVNLELTRIYGAEPMCADDIVEQYAPAARRLAPLVTDTSLLIHEALGRDENVLLEGAQATMLDIDVGTYPFVTSSSPSAGGACLGAGISPLHVREVIGVVKAYTSRVGSGPFPTELHDAVGDWIIERGHEYGTSTGRRRRCGWIDLVSLRYAARINGLTGIALTRLDILSGLNELKLCVRYRLPDGTETCEYPLDTNVLAQTEAVYESLPGFEEDISGARSFAELPENAQAYCQRVAELLGVPLALISVGAERNDLVALRWPM